MPIRVLIIDDSRLMRGLLHATLARFPEFEVVGEASDGKRGEILARELRPDVITMDVLMPMMGGIEAIEIIMRDHPTPIVVVADLATHDASVAMEAMARGAVDVFPKPQKGLDEAAARALTDILRRSAGIRLAKNPQPTGRRARHLLAPRTMQILGIVASTGGPRGLRTILQVLPHPFPCPIAIVQHTSAGSTEALAAWLSASSPHHVVVAQEGQSLGPGQVVVAPSEVHLTVEMGLRVRLLRGSLGDGHRPCGNVLLTSLAKHFRSYAVGVVLSGLGSDGAAGLRALEDAGGLVMIEDPATAVVSGMPTAALTSTNAPVVDVPEALASALRRLHRGGTS